MAVSVGDTISASDYNGLRTRVESILVGPSGTPSDSSGYAMGMSSSAVAGTQNVTAAQMDNLRTDIIKCKRHQLNVDGNLHDISAGMFIGANATIPATDPNVVLNADGTVTMNSSFPYGGFNDYETETTSIETNKDIVHPTQATTTRRLTPSITGTATVGAWGNSSATYGANVQIDSIATFSSLAHYRAFWNAGGTISISTAAAKGSAAASSKESDWITLLSNAGTVTFGKGGVTTTGSGTVTTYTAEYLRNNASSGLLTYLKAGSAANYAENEYRVVVTVTTTSTVAFKITVYLNDNDAGDQQAGSDTGGGGEEGDTPTVTPAGPGEDEGVLIHADDSLTVTVTDKTASGSYVSVNSASFTNSAWS